MLKITPVCSLRKVRLRLPSGLYANEYAVMLQFTEDGEKVVRFEEFVDSAYSMNFFQKLLTAAEAKKA
jgi:hypothetical protein